MWTIGRILIDPNAPSIVPGRAEMQVQFRDTDTGILARFEQALHELVAEAERAGPCEVAIAPISKSEPAQMDPAFQREIERAAERHAPGLHMRMPSGAGHDAQILARRMRSAMLFVPSINGRQPSLVREHERGGHHARRAGFRRRRRRDPAGGVNDMALVIQESLRGLFYAPYYAALALGAYEQEGVEVRFVSAPTPGQAPDGLFDGTVDVAWGGPMRVNQMYEERPDCDLVCFAEAVTRDPFMLIGREPQPAFPPGRAARARIATVSEVPTPWLCLQEDLRRAGIDPATLRPGRRPHDAGEHGGIARGALDVVQLFQPFAEELIASGEGHLWYAAADRGPCSYTSFYARRGTLAAKRDEMLKLVRAFTGRRNGCTFSRPTRSPMSSRRISRPCRDRCSSPRCARYYDLGIWGRDPILPRGGYERLVAGLVSGGFVRGTPFATAVDNSLAERAVADRPATCWLEDYRI